ncbi:hypothetical protein NX059_011055 [Plenodomus lindquistii]|nr:hypothetical protein NX059_011055 [Plenodomus lindquistii]
MVDQHFLDFSVANTEAACWTTQLRPDVAAFYADEESNTMEASQEVSSKGWINGTDQYGQPYVFDPDNAYGYLTPNMTHGIAISYVSESSSYLAILELSTRQIPAANVPVEPVVHTSEPVIFQKEISSYGRANTVDVIYSALPFWLYANPELLHLVLDPVFEYQESGLYENQWAMHDLGASYPSAVGYIDEYNHGRLKVPVETSGDMILMAYAYCKSTHNVEYLAKHYRIMRQWAEFLIGDSLFPSNQLSTVDSEGRLANQTNLALKGIIAIEAMSHIADIINQTDDASSYATTATSYFATWRSLAIDPLNTHVLLTYQYRTSWCTLHNIYPALLLDLSVVPKDIYLLQSAWYSQVSQIFGVPLDCCKP